MFEHAPVFGEHADEKLVSASEGKKLAKFADAVARWTVYLSLFLLPLLYCSGVVDVIDLPKQAFLTVAAAVGALAWLGKMLATRRLEIRRSPLHLLVLVYFAAYLIAAWFSKSRYLSFVGDFGQEHAGAATLACLVVLYFVTVNVLRDARDVRKALGWMMMGALPVLLQSGLQALGVPLLPGTAAGFNLIGTGNSLGIYSAVIAVVAMGWLLMPGKGGRGETAMRIGMMVLLVLAALHVATLQYWAIWLAVIVGSLVLVVYGMIKADRGLRVTMLAVPMAAIVIGALFSFVRFPFSFGLPAEVMPSFAASWQISREALANRPLLGSGPGTFLYDYTRFRSPDLNATLFWNVPFDRAASHLLTLLATTGIVGLAVYLLMTLFLALRTKMKLWRGHDDWLMTLAVFAGWSALFVGRIVYSSNITLEFMFWMLTALLAALQWHSWSEARLDQSPRAALGLSFVFIVAIVFSVSGLYLQGQRLVAESHFTRGASLDVTKGGNLDAAMAHLTRATELNGRSDLYYRTLSQAYTLQISRLAAEAGGKPTDEQAHTIALAAMNAINAGKHAADLNPSDVRNWEMLAGMYRDLGSAVPGASDAARQAYAAAADLDPNNPVYATELGKLYLNASDAARAQIGKDTKADDRDRLQKAADEALDKAGEQFDRAVMLKRDYAPAHYWIAAVLVRRGKTSDAIAKLEAVRNYNPKDLGVGFQLAILYYQNGQKDKSIAELGRLIQVEPHYANARWYLAAMYEEQGQIDSAIAQIEAVKKDNPDNPDVQKRLDDLNAKKNGTAPTPSGGGLPVPPSGNPPIK